jgi:formate dehydrogenase maturation protein FdhE
VQQQKGFQLHWIGVGTWDTPDTGILENHLQAWMLSRDNALRGNPQKLQELEDDALMQELLRLIQEMLAAFQSMIDKPGEPDQVVDEMLGEFHEQLKLALDLYQRDGDEPSLELLDAIRVINEIRGFTDHWVGV